MDIKSEEKKLNYMTRNELYSIRKEKLRIEIEAAKRLLQKKIEPIEIADNFFHNMIKIIEDGILSRNPYLTREDLFQKIVENFNIAENIKKQRTRGKNNWQKYLTFYLD